MRKTDLIQQKRFKKIKIINLGFENVYVIFRKYLEIWTWVSVDQNPGRGKILKEIWLL